VFWARFSRVDRGSTSRESATESRKFWFESRAARVNLT
jgi:hypothetical protein